MTNKKSGTNFENELCEKLSEGGFWCRLMYPALDGSQPFDVMAIDRTGHLYCIECKDCQNDVFPLNRVENNQEISLSNLINNFMLEDRVLFAFKTSVGIYIVVARKVLHLIFLSGFEKGNKSIKLNDIQKMRNDFKKVY